MTEIRGVQREGSVVNGMARLSSKLGLYGGLLTCVFTLPALSAAELPEVLDSLLKESPSIKAALGDERSAEKKARETLLRAWTPNFEITGELGKQRYDSRTETRPGDAPADNDFETVNSERLSVRATQTLFDFGRSNFQVREGRATARQSKAVTQSTRDGVLLDALTAHWSVVRSVRTLAYARQSEASVRNLTKLENSLVELGKGYESNVLQAKVQLASAEARRTRAEGALDIARARVSAVFGDLAEQVEFDTVMLPLAELLPQSLEEAEMIALENNKQLKVGAHRSSAILNRARATTATEFLPKLQIVAEHGIKNDVDVALPGTKVEDNKVLLQLQYNFNLGGAGKAAADSIKAEYDASTSRERETRELVLEQVAVAWRNLTVAKINRNTLGNQVRIAAKFLEMATKERKMGRRSLLDVLSAEVSLIDSLSDLAAVEADVATAGLTLLQAIGRLDVGALKLVATKDAIPEVMAF